MADRSGVMSTGSGPRPGGGGGGAAVPSTPSAIDLVGVHKRFGAVEAVRGIDLRVRPGEVVAFLGPNGAGKTTTIDMVLGLSAPSDGTVSVYGLEPREAVRRGLVSAVMQSGGLLRDLTVAETVTYTSLLFDGTRSPDEVMERAGIAAIANRMVGRCSGGEQQRLRFAMALLPDPDLLLLDEPTQGMDVEGRRSFWAAIRLDADAGRTVIFATHYLEEADAYADRVVLVRKGEIVADGTAAEVKAMASGRTVRATLPDPDEAALRSLPGVDHVEIRGTGVVVHGTESDAVARYLLTETTAKDLEITALGLEEAFVALTGSDGAPPHPPPPGGRPGDQPDGSRLARRSGRPSVRRLQAGHRPPRGPLPVAQPPHRAHRRGAAGVLLPDLWAQQLLRHEPGRTGQRVGGDPHLHGALRCRPRHL